MKGLLKRFENLPFPIVGVGVTAFNRVMPAFFVPGYQIVCYKESREIPEISKKCKVLAIENECKNKIKRLNSLEILSQGLVQDFIREQGPAIGIMVYKSSTKIQEICQKNRWQLLTNSPEIRDPYENKKIFRETIIKLGLAPIEGEVMEISKFNEEAFTDSQKQYGQNLVLKLPEVTKGGGIGNTFVNNVSELASFWLKVKKFSPKYNPKYLIIERKIKGISPSITGCVTRKGILTGVVQTQITDIPEVIDTKLGSGMFVGHDWSYCHYPAEMQEQAREIAQKFGEELKNKGYKGVFGIDLLVEENTQKVYPCECNPRFTGAFPVYSMIQFKQNEVPFEVFHLLEHLGIDYDYDYDFEQVQQSYWQKKEGAHLVLCNRTGDWVEISGEVKAGVYRIEGDDLQFVKPGFSFLDIENKDEFVLTDGVPFSGEIIKPNMRILKIIFPSRILANGGKDIDQRTKQIVELVYQKLALKKIEAPKDYIVQEAEF